jgi:hypothetical protein
VGRRLVLERVHTDHHVLAGRDPLLLLVRLVGDHLLHVALFDRATAPPGLHLGHQLPRRRLQAVGQVLDVPRTAQRIGDVGDAELVLQHLLVRTASVCARWSRDRDRLVEARQRHRLHAAERRGSAWTAARTMLFSACCSVSVEPSGVVRSIIDRGSRAPKRSRITDARNAARGTCDLLEEVHVGVEDPAQARSELSTPMRAPAPRPRRRSRSETANAIS